MNGANAVSNGSDVNGELDYYDIVIVGGGMVGASLALLLARQPRNWRVLVVEANPDQLAHDQYAPSFDARSTALSYSTRQIFEGLNLWGLLAQRVAPISDIEVSDRGHVASTRLQAGEQGVDAFGYVVENRWLGEVLNKALAEASVDVAAPATLEQVKMVRAGARLQLSDRDTPITAGLLVAADGARSALREKLGISCTVDDYGQSALIANVALAEPHCGVAYERFTEAGPMALLPLTDSVQSGVGGARSALVWTLPPEEAEAMRQCSEAEFLAALQEQFGYRQGQLKGVGERVLYPLKRLQADEQVRRHLVVVGNAAHSLHPVAGQGFNLALRDVAVLAATLNSECQGDVTPGELGLLEHYLRRQAGDQQRTITASDWLPRLFAQPGYAAAGARGLGVLALDMIPPLRGQFARYGMGLE